jgi:hypothetical protein
MLQILQASWNLSHHQNTGNLMLLARSKDSRLASEQTGRGPILNIGLRPASVQLHPIIAINKDSRESDARLKPDTMG